MAIATVGEIDGGDELKWLPNMVGTALALSLDRLLLATVGEINGGDECETGEAIFSALLAVAIVGGDESKYLSNMVGTASALSPDRSLLAKHFFSK